MAFLAARDKILNKCMSSLPITSSDIRPRYICRGSLGILYPKISAMVPSTSSQNERIFTQDQNMWEGLAFNCPHCLQQYCCWPNCLLLIWNEIKKKKKKRVKFLQPNSLHLLELVDVCWVLNIDCQSLSNNSTLNSCSHFTFIYTVFIPCRFKRPLYSLETILEGVCEYAPVNTSITSFPSSEDSFLISVSKKCLNWRYIRCINLHFLIRTHF